jgi:membrane protease subunit (stomatin/prohibitin family)
MAIEVIEWKDDTGQEMVWRYSAGGEIKLGAQLVVSENQWAVFFRDGKALDTFAAGRHTLTTANIPLLTRLIGLPFGGTSPFRADVYYVAKKVFTGMKWGTREPVVFRDAELSMVRLRANGRFAVRVTDPQLFVNQIVGSQGRYTADAIESYLRDIVVARLNDVLGTTLKTIFDLPQHYDELGEGLKGRVAGDFQKYGLEMTDFFVGAITPPDEVQKVIDERTGMAAVGDPNAYLKFKAAQAMGDAGKGGAGDGGAAAGVGLGVGAGIGMTVAGMIRDAMAPGSSGAAAAGAFCASCGAKLPDGAKFCPGCGTKRA